MLARPRLFAGLLPLLSLACGGGNLASELAEPPALELPGQATCRVKKSQARPLVVEWPSADRAALEARVRRGVVAVRYSDCEMELLEGCKAPGEYRYVPVTLKSDHVRMRDVDELYAQVPLGAARLESQLEKSGELNVAMTIVGRLEADPSPAGGLALDRGSADCARATHVIAAITVGAFDFYAGGSGAIGAAAGIGPVEAGGRSTAAREKIAKDGDGEACLQATVSDTRPPANCGAFLRVDVVAVAGAIPPAVAERPATGTPTGTGRSKVQRGNCPKGMALIPGGTLPADDPQRGSDRAVATFCLDVTEVRADAYRACVAAGRCKATPADVEVLGISGAAATRWEGLCTARNGLGTHPINCVNAAEAAAYCAAQGRRLPTDVEWQYAARGGSEARRYPWGDAPLGPSLLNGCGPECAELTGQSRALYSESDGWQSTAAVGSFPGGASRWGPLDLAGNVAEWTSSRPACPAGGKCGDPRIAVGGGSFGDDDARSLRSSAVFVPYAPDARSVAVGFRCAVTP